MLSAAQAQAEPAPGRMRMAEAKGEAPGGRRHTLAVRRGDPRGILPALPRPADGRADGAAQARRRAGRVEFGDAGVPGAAARRLCLCAPARARAAADAGGDPYRRARCGCAVAADRHDGDEPARRCRAGDLGALAVRRFDRPPVLRDRRAGAADPALVQRGDARAGSLCALRRFEHRQLRRADRLSLARRAADVACGARAGCGPAAMPWCSC